MAKKSKANKLGGPLGLNEVGQAAQSVAAIAAQAAPVVSQAGTVLGQVSAAITQFMSGAALFEVSTPFGAFQLKVAQPAPAAAPKARRRAKRR